MVEAGVQAELESLRARLAQSELDKAALQSDVEMLCLQTTSNTTFNSSSVLQERIRYTGAQRFWCGVGWWECMPFMGPGGVRVDRTLPFV